VLIFNQIPRIRARAAAIRRRVRGVSGTDINMSQDGRPDNIVDYESHLLCGIMLRK
jgi:hypothetical protein